SSGVSATMSEPRRHPVRCGALLLPPSSDSFGLFAILRRSMKGDILPLSACCREFSWLASDGEFSKSCHFLSFTCGFWFQPAPFSSPCSRKLRLISHHQLWGGLASLSMSTESLSRFLRDAMRSSRAVPVSTSFSLPQPSYHFTFTFFIVPPGKGCLR